MKEDRWVFFLPTSFWGRGIPRAIAHIAHPISPSHHTTITSRNIYYDNLSVSLSFLYVLLKTPSGWLVGHIRKYIRNIKQGCNNLDMMTPLFFPFCCCRRMFAKSAYFRLLLPLPALNRRYVCKYMLECVDNIYLQWSCSRHTSGPKFITGCNMYIHTYMIDISKPRSQIYTPLKISL